MRIVVAVLLVLAAACGADDRAVDRAAERAAERGPDKPIDADAKARVRSALLSIYYHGYPGRFDLTVFEPPIELLTAVEAARILADNGTSETARYRLREAITVLAADTLTDDGYAAPIRAALDTLGAPVEAIVARLREGTYVSRTQRELAVYDVLAESGLGMACGEATTDVGFDPFTRATVVAVKVSKVQRNFDDVARVFDPQNWDECNDFFAASYVAKKVGTTYPRDALGTAEVAPSPPAAGSTWRDVLYEEFDFTPASYPGWIKNLFEIDAYRQTSMFYYEYALYESINTKLALALVPKGLARNQGYVAARLVPDGTVTVTVMKTLQYDATLDSLNPAAEWFLRPMGEQARSMACTCTVPTQPRSWLEIILSWLRGLFD